MKKNLIVIIGIIFTVLFLTGCFSTHNEHGTLIKEGKVMKIEYDIIFGGTFTDWRNEIYFDDGTVLWTNNNDDLSDIKINMSGKFYFEKNYFEYRGATYKFHDFKRVIYYEDDKYL